MIRLVACFLLCVCAPLAKASDLRQQYVGRSGCAQELQPSLNHYGIRLDKTRHAFLEARVFKSRTILLIVQRNGETDKCGVVRDVIQSRETDSSFVFDCVDERNPGSVVVGTWPQQHPSVSGPATEAWTISLEQLRFVPLAASVTCKARSYAGPDEGDDLATWVRKRAARP